MNASANKEVSKSWESSLKIANKNVREIFDQVINLRFDNFYVYEKFL